MLFYRIPDDIKRVLDLGTGDGRLLKLLKSQRPHIHGVAVDVSPIMIDYAKRNFANDYDIKVIEHYLGKALPNI